MRSSAARRGFRPRARRPKGATRRGAISPAKGPDRLTLTRRTRFAAAHRYRRPEWSDARNLEVFGACANPSYHGHSYVCDVTVSGRLDEATGFVVDLGLLDRILAEEIRERFDHRNINVDVPEFAEGRMVPTGENLARFIAARVQARLGEVAHVTRVTVAEDDTLSVSYEPNAGV